MPSFGCFVTFQASILFALVMRKLHHKFICWNIPFKHSIFHWKVAMTFKCRVGCLFPIALQWRLVRGMPDRLLLPMTDHPWHPRLCQAAEAPPDISTLRPFPSPPKMLPLFQNPGTLLSQDHPWHTRLWQAAQAPPEADSLFRNFALFHHLQKCFLCLSPSRKALKSQGFALFCHLPPRPFPPSLKMLPLSLYFVKENIYNTCLETKALCKQICPFQKSQG